MQKIKYQPLVSVIIPTFNRCDYLRIAIDSVLSQTYPNFELLILNNCSDDNTQKVISSYTDPRIKSITHLANIGPVANWYYGMHWASGELFSVLGDDDYYRPDFIAARVEAYELFPNVVAVYSDHEECDAIGTIISTTRKFECSQGREIFGNELLKSLHHNNRTWQIGSGLYRRNPVVNWWDDCIHAGRAIDTAIQVKIACQSRAAVIPNKGLVYRMHSNQESSGVTYEKIKKGHINAYLEPLLYENKEEYVVELIAGAEWALKYLAANAKDANRNESARRIYFLLLSLKPFNLWIFLRIMQSYAPRWISKVLKKAFTTKVLA